jgi:ribosomal protein S12 methylthiotransferase accessory factor
MTSNAWEPLLQQSAEALLNNQPLDQQPEQVRSLLMALDYSQRDPPSVNQHRARLLQAAAGFTRLFQLRSPDAPGLTFFGAEVDPGGIDPGGIGQPRLPASGVGLSFRSAFEGCIGEGVEHLSQFECASDSLPQLTQTISDKLQTPPPPIDWITARRLSDQSATLFPADICLRRGSGQTQTPPWPLRIGGAAGTSFSNAVLHGLLELIERDAAALWWRGGRRGCLIPLDSETTNRALAFFAAARGDTQRRQSWLLDITTDLGVPTVAAISVDQAGQDFACGLAARLSLPQAATAAIHEMCQMELAHRVVAAKRRESGDAALNTHDRAHLRRASELNLRDCQLLHPLPPQPGHRLEITTTDHDAALHQLVDHLLHLGIETFAIDLTRPAFGVPVARVLSPMLEKEPSHVIGDRLQAAIDSTGGGHAHTRGIPLM